MLLRVVPKKKSLEQVCQVQRPVSASTRSMMDFSMDVSADLDESEALLFSPFFLFLSLFRVPFLSFPLLLIRICPHVQWYTSSNLYLCCCRCLLIKHRHTAPACPPCYREPPHSVRIPDTACDDAEHTSTRARQRQRELRPHR